VFVYKITNTVNGKMYIGLTTGTVKKRWREHICAARMGVLEYPLYRAMRKYGTAAFKCIMIYEAVDKRELQAVECGLIAQYGTMTGAGGYNQTAGGERGDGMYHPTGEHSYAAKLTEEIVAFIRADAQKEISNGALVMLVAKQFGVVASRDCLRDARRGDGWKHMNKQHPPVRSGQGNRKSAEGIRLMRENGLRSAASGQLRIAVEASKEKVRGNRWRAKLTAEQARAIYSDPRPYRAIERAYGMAHGVVSHIKRGLTWAEQTKEIRRG